MEKLDKYSFLKNKYTSSISISDGGSLLSFYQTKQYVAMVSRHLFLQSFLAFSDGSRQTDTMTSWKKMSFLVTSINVGVIFL